MTISSDQQPSSFNHLISWQQGGVGLILISLLALSVLPGAGEPWVVAGLLGLVTLGAALTSWLRGSWQILIFVGSFIVVTALFDVARAYPNQLWLVMIALWAGGTWFIGHVDDAPQSIFHQALASFLALEVFMVLQLWPINLLSKAVIAVSFPFFLWHEFVRTASTRQRLQESVVPFVLIVVLMALTGQWFTF